MLPHYRPRLHECKRDHHHLLNGLDTEVAMRLAGKQKLTLLYASGKTAILG